MNKSANQILSIFLILIALAILLYTGVGMAGAIAAVLTKLSTSASHHCEECMQVLGGMVLLLVFSILCLGLSQALMFSRKILKVFAVLYITVFIMIGATALYDWMYTADI